MGSFFQNETDYPNHEPYYLGLSADRINTNEQARPVRWFAGTARLPITFLTQAFNQRADPEELEVKLGDDEIIGYHYYANLAGLISVGPVDQIHAIWFGDKLQWEGLVNRSGDSTPLTIPGRGTATLYWGTEKTKQKE